MNIAIFVVVMNVAVFVFFILFVLIIVDIAIFVVVMAVHVAALAELNRFDGPDRFKHRDAIGLSGLDHVEEAFFKGGAVGNKNRSVTHSGDLLGRSLEIVGVSAHWHDRHHVHFRANQVRDNITEDVGRYRDRRSIT